MPDPGHREGDHLMTATVSPLAGTAIAHREAFRDYVLREAEPWHREHLGRLYGLWDEWNATYYEGAMTSPYILLNEPTAPQVYGCCGLVSGFGGKSEIRLRPSLLAGTHPHMRQGLGYAEGRFTFVADVLLHEMVHQWQQEVSGELDEAYHGHGPAFRDTCNRIGAVLGLAPVRTSKKRGKDADLPSCSQWPHNVRPSAWYQDAYIPPYQHNKDLAADPDVFNIPVDPDQMLAALCRLLTPSEASTLAIGLATHFASQEQNAGIAVVPASWDAISLQQEVKVPS